MGFITGAFMDETRLSGAIQQDTEAAEHRANALAIVGIYAPKRGLEASTGPANG
jgi:hypothetical protein